MVNSPRQPTHVGITSLPELFDAPADAVAKRFIDFFTANIRNANTRQAYARAVLYFNDWCLELGLTLDTLEPVHVAAYIEQLTQEYGAPNVKQHVAAIRMLFVAVTLARIIHGWHVPERSEGRGMA